MPYTSILSYVISGSRHRPYPLLMIDMGLSIALFLFPNVLMGMSFMRAAAMNSTATPTGLLAHAALFLRVFDLQNILLWVIANLILGILFLVLRRNVFYPMLSIIRQMYDMFGAIAQEVPKNVPAITSMRMIAGDMARMTALAQEYYHKHQNAQHALIQARDVLAKITAQQQAMVTTTSREMLAQYQSVLAYANYLEEQIAYQAVDPILRYDFDDVSESSFNLKLIAGSLELIQRDRPATERIDVPLLMQQTLLALSASLDRRSMKLTTVEVDLNVMAQSNPAIVAHVLWMMLLGTVRHAADESTLRLRCLYSYDRTRCLISIVLSERTTVRLNSTETAPESPIVTPEMFAETIRIHGNMQLAELLMQQLDGGIEVLPLTCRACEICLSIPAA